MLIWTDRRPAPEWLRAQRTATITFADLRERFGSPARAVGIHRATLVSPAQPLLDRVAGLPIAAVVDVRLDTLADVRDLLGYALEPAWRAGCRLVVHADRTLAGLDPAKYVDDWFEHAWTLGRARHLAELMATADGPLADAGRPAPVGSLDPEQLAAVAAHDGVVQVIAPAGSGKTTVLVERVRELLRRGAAPDRILCMTFNRDAAAELRGRLAAAGVYSVDARTFHSTGRRILEEEGLLRGEPRSLSLGQWRRLSARAMKDVGQDGRWIEPPDAQALVASLKLGRLLTAAQCRRMAAPDPESQTLARLYELYEEQMLDDGCHDFDDQIFGSVRALRSGAPLRARWQARFDRVLVDEYQDIEPAQELLVQILAAPQDSVFAVGDEDQVLYGWRRASVGRMVALDQVYPGLRRVALETNYRCPVEVVDRSAQLIARNELRFPKVIRPAPGRVSGAPSPASTRRCRPQPYGRRASSARARGARSSSSLGRPGSCDSSPRHVSRPASESAPRRQCSRPGGRRRRSRPISGWRPTRAAPLRRMCSRSCATLRAACGPGRN